jgi:hypothetical protein
MSGTISMKLESNLSPSPGAKLVHFLAGDITTKSRICWKVPFSVLTAMSHDRRPACPGDALVLQCYVRLYYREGPS